MEKRELKVGDVVQIIPNSSARPEFFSCLMVVSEPKPWGAQGYFSIPGQPGDVYYRAKWEEMEYVGAAPWVAS